MAEKTYKSVTVIRISKSALSVSTVEAPKFIGLGGRLRHLACSLMQEYQKSLELLGVPITSFQQVQTEYDDFPGKYDAGANGTFLLAVTASAGGVDSSPCVEDVAGDGVDSMISDGFLLEYVTTFTPKGTLPSPRAPMLRAADLRTCLPGGCIALKRIDVDGSCEMKRLYVAPSFRGAGLGTFLCRTLFDEVHRINKAHATMYKRMVLDTLHRLEGAIPLYRSLGFVECERYVFNPMEDVVFMSRVVEEHE